MWGSSRDSGFGVPMQCALIFWVQGSEPLFPYQTGSLGSDRLSQPLARLAQDPLSPFQWSQLYPSTSPVTSC